MFKPALLSLVLSAAGCLDPSGAGNLVPRMVVEDSSLPRIELAGALFHAEAFGDPRAPLVIVLHGGPGDDYRGMLPLRALASDGYRVVFWDQRGAGLSQRFDPEFYTFSGYLDDLRLLIEHFTAIPGQPFVFIGHSWGAMYATWFIDEHGDYGGRLRGAILTEPAAFNKTQLDAYLKRYMQSYALTGDELRDAFWIGQFMSPDDHARADYVRTVLALEGVPCEHRDPANPAPLWREGAAVNAALLSLAKGGFDWTTRLSAFRHEVLFLRGDLGSCATLDQQQELAKSFPASRIVTIAGVGHHVIWERSEEYLAQARAYFAAIGFVGGAL